MDPEVIHPLGSVRIPAIRGAEDPPLLYSAAPILGSLHLRFGRRPSRVSERSVMAKYLREDVLAMSAYTPGEQASDTLRLASCSAGSHPL